MPKRRPKRKLSAGATSQSRPGPGDARQANLQRFTTKGWALTAQILGQRRDRVAILDLLGFFDWLGDRNLAAIKAQIPPLPCRAGCAYCCYVGPDRPDLLPPEAFRIATYLAGEGAEALTLVRARLAALAANPAGASDAKTPCLLLDHDRCLIYPVRPMRCRAQHSPDAEACQQNYLGQRETMPLLREPALLYKSLHTGMQLGLKEVGLQDVSLRLSGAVALALEHGALERWLNGDTVFEQVVYPDTTEEKRFLLRFARQARLQAQEEKRSLRQATAVFLDSPGKWALYAMSGIAPSAPEPPPQRR